MRLRWARHLPALAGAATLLVPSLLLAWNLAAGHLAPRWRIGSPPALAGVVAASGVAPDWRSLASGAYQKWLATGLGERIVGYADAVKLRNQVLYSLFDSTSVPSVAIGRHRELYEWPYIREYCARDIAALLPEARGRVADLRRLQDWYAAHRRVFLYLITPSKAAQYPGLFPPGYVCRAPAAARDGFVAAYTSLLDRAGVHSVDAAGLIAGARASYDIALFPRGGTHWNMIAAALAAQRVIAAVNALGPRQRLVPFDFQWRRSERPGGSDRDLLDLLNLRWPDDRYPVPVVAFQPHVPPDGCATARIAEVGGSFLDQLNAALSATACPPRISHWFYFQLGHRTFDGAVARFQPGDDTAMGAERAAELTGDADIVLLEENEQYIARSFHARLFEDFLLGTQ